MRIVNSIRAGKVPAPVVVGLAYLGASIPLSNIAAHRLRGIDLREVGTGTVSGTSLHQVAGFGPLAVVGVGELAKGALGPALASRARPVLAALSAATAITAHNWSPFLHWAGGRGVSVALGATMPMAPEATVLLGAGLGIGRAVGQSAAGCAVAYCLMPPLLARTRGRNGWVMALSLVVPMVAKRLVGNGPPPRTGRPYLYRLVFDRDTRWPAPPAELN